MMGRLWISFGHVPDRGTGPESKVPGPESQSEDIVVSLIPC